MDETRRQLFVIFAGAFGLVVGSFLNVCIFRMPRECMSVARGRSKCPRCRREIAWFDNLPVVSWVLLGGKCRGCGERISPRYAMIELVTGALFAWAAFVQLYRAPDAQDVERVTLFAIQCYLVAAILVQTFVDIDFEILLDEINYSGAAFGFIASTAFPEVLYGRVPSWGWLAVFSKDLQPHAYGFVQSLLGCLLGFGMMFAIDVIGRAVFAKRLKQEKMDQAMGGGDWKYMAFLGAFLGWQGVALASIVAMVAGAVFGVGKLIAFRRMGRVAFGPFLSVGALTVLFARPLLDRGIQAYLDLLHRLASD